MPDSSSPTRDDVLWSYRTLLNRDPESDRVVAQHCTHRSVRDLLQAITSSAEFQSASERVAASESAARERHPLNLPRKRIDVHLAPAEMSAAIAKVKATWTGLGELGAHHSVLTDDRFLPQNLAPSLGEFWKSGEVEAEVVVDIFRHYGLDPKGKVCVEYGCGVGRVTAALSRHFGTVYGYDISANHLKHAQERFSEMKLTNIRTVECSNSFLEELQPCDAFYSRIVFQHNPPPIILALIRQTVRSLKPNGIAIFQVPTYRDDYAFNAAEWLSSSAHDMEMHCIPQSDAFAAIAAERGMLMEIREDGSTGSNSFISNTFVVRKFF